MAIKRIALSRALVEHGFLHIKRRRIPLPNARDNRPRYAKLRAEILALTRLILPNVLKNLGGWRSAIAASASIPTCGPRLSGLVPSSSRVQQRTSSSQNAGPATGAGIGEVGFMRGPLALKTSIENVTASGGRRAGQARFSRRKRLAVVLPGFEPRRNAG